MEYRDMLLNLPGMEPIRRGFRTFGQLFRQAHQFISRISSKARGIISSHTIDSTTSDDLEANIPPVTDNDLGRRTSNGEKSIMTAETPRALSISVPSLHIEKDPDALTPTTPVSPGKLLWRNAIRSVKLHSAVQLPFNTSSELHRQRTSSSNLTGGCEKKRMGPGGEPVKAVFQSRIAALMPKLKILETTQDLAAHQALVRHLQFSPDGRYLATSR